MSRLVEKERLERVVEPVCRAHGVELVDVNYGREPLGAVVRIIIDRPRATSEPQPGAGVSLADCQNVSRDASTALDVADVIEGAYRLEVTSPGIERPLVKLHDFERFAGHEVKLQTREPISERRKFQGTLLGVEDQTVRFEQDGAVITIPYTNIAKCNLVFRFSGTQARG